METGSQLSKNSNGFLWNEVRAIIPLTEQVDLWCCKIVITLMNVDMFLNKILLAHEAGVTSILETLGAEEKSDPR